ncbi:T1N6.14 protein, partial [Thalictrum thalictroides]
KKRKAVDNVDNPNANYFKLRALVRDLRPHFIEVLRTPDFRTSKAAHEIRKKMKRVMDVCKKMTIETASIEMSKKPYESETVSVEDQEVTENSAELPLSGNDSEKLEDGQIQGSYVVGGSNLGWNFIMYPSNKPVYYGVSKESRQNSMKTNVTS